jgi:tRNA A-37 threonylcarbamoyl transferase component Bud32/SAM-dependent methyltransferase
LGIVWENMMKRAGKKVKQFLRNGPSGLLWLGYVLGIAPWAYHATRPLHEVHRQLTRRRWNEGVEHRLEMLRGQFSQRPSIRPSRLVALADLSPELEVVVGPMRRDGEEITLADIDQDGFLCPRLGRLWPAPSVDVNAFVPRNRSKIVVVDRGGWIGIRKEFGLCRADFVNELQAALDLSAAGCNVPEVLDADFERLSITFAYIHGMVIREALAVAGARIRDHDMEPSQSFVGRRRQQRQRLLRGRQLVPQVVDADAIRRISEALLGVHRAGYVLEDIKYGNVIIESTTRTPYFIDFERAMPLRLFSRDTAVYMRDRDAEKINQHFNADLLTTRVLRRTSTLPGGKVYAPPYARAGIRWGPIWNPDIGVGRWRYLLQRNLPVPRGGRVLDLGASNGFNALQMLRAGAAEVVAIEIDPSAIEQGIFLKRVFEWADNTEYRFSYVHGSHAELDRMNLGRFDLVTALCTLYYLSAQEMANTVSYLREITETLVLQCNTDRLIARKDAETFIKASLSFTVELVRKHGFPSVSVIAPRGYSRPLVIARASETSPAARQSGHIPVVPRQDYHMHFRSDAEMTSTPNSFPAGCEGTHRLPRTWVHHGPRRYEVPDLADRNERLSIILQCG